jgi:hypothetical protein
MFCRELMKDLKVVLPVRWASVSTTALRVDKLGNWRLK